MKTMIILLALACAGCGRRDVLMVDESGCKYIGTTYGESTRGSLTALTGADGKQICGARP